MSDNSTPPTGPRQTDQWLEPGPTNMQVIYILYLAGFVIGLTPIIGVVMAYMNRGRAEGWVATHYTWAIRTFWIAILYAFISAVLFFLVIGFFLMFAVAVWVVVRCIIGLQAVGRGEPIKNPQSWLI
jgi:uncharacterized membrane protein